MKEQIKKYSASAKMFFLWAGIIATIAYRVIIVLNFYSPYWVKVFWYIGTIGFIFYFGYRFDVQRRESNLVRDYDLANVVRKAKMDSKKKKVLIHVVQTRGTSKAKWNSLFIFLLSIVALIIGILLDIGLISFG